MNNIEKAESISILSMPSSTEAQDNGWIVLNNLYKNYLKRVFDLFLCVLILPFAIPIILFLILLVKIDSEGNSIYKSERIGKDGRKFQCLKLRTMYKNSHEKLQSILDRNEVLKKEYEKYCKLRSDPRITPVGKFLRAFSLDELPQVFNVLVGDMSFVGPCPAFETEISKYSNNYEDYKSVRPGITGLWQVNGRNETSFQARVELDSLYASNSNFKLDLKILLQTIPAALSKKGAY